MWLDGHPPIKIPIMLNGVTELVITKIDVLNKLPEIKVASTYQYAGYEGQEMPYDLDQDNPQPQFTSYPGWNKSLNGIDDFNLLPEETKNYVVEVEKLLNVPVSMVSTGPDRKELIVR